MNRLTLIPALVAALSLAACDEHGAEDAHVAPTASSAPRGESGSQGIVAGTGGSGTGAFDGRMPIAESVPARSIYSVRNSRGNQ